MYLFNIPHNLRLVSSAKPPFLLYLPVSRLETFISYEVLHTHVFLHSPSAMVKDAMHDFMFIAFPSRL